MACALASGSSSMRAIWAPRSQRVPISSRATSSSPAIRRSRRAFAARPPPGAAVRHA
jgi:hypothetical protein